LGIPTNRTITQRLQGPIFTHACGTTVIPMDVAPGVAFVLYTDAEGSWTAAPAVNPGNFIGVFSFEAAGSEDASYYQWDDTHKLFGQPPEEAARTRHIPARPRLMNLRARRSFG
jgi:hypothetical protein